MMRAGVLRGRVYFLPKFPTCTLTESNAITRPDNQPEPQMETAAATTNLNNTLK